MVAHEGTLTIEQNIFALSSCLQKRLSERTRPMTSASGMVAVLAVLHSKTVVQDTL